MTTPTDWDLDFRAALTGSVTLYEKGVRHAEDIVEVAAAIADAAAKLRAERQSQSESGVRCHAPGCTSTALYGIDSPVFCWSHAGSLPEVKPSTVTYIPECKDQSAIGMVLAPPTPPPEPTKERCRERVIGGDAPGGEWVPCDKPKPCSSHEPSPSPRPVKVEKCGAIYDSEGDKNAEFCALSDGHEICRAVNAHRDLLEIVRAASEWACEDCGRDFGESKPVKCDWCRKARAALALAEKP